MQTPFHTSTEPEPHAARTRALLAAHPQARALIGPNPWTMLISIGVVGSQTAVAAWFGQLGANWWWLALATAWCIGAFANHCLYVIIHEATHDLIFRRRWMNRVAAIFSDLPNLVPAAMGFRVYHLKHHSSQGDYTQDMDLPGVWEARRFGGSATTKALWLLLFPIVQSLRVSRCEDYSMFERWVIASFAVAAGYAFCIYYFLGGMALVYLFASFWFSIGLHPLGGRWIQEHYTYDPKQETSSYYGPLNVVALNVGYHNEHHDLPSVAWNRLPALKAMASEFYAPLRSFNSWARLVLDFIGDPRFSVASRVVRRGRDARPKS